MMPRVHAVTLALISLSLVSEVLAQRIIAPVQCPSCFTVHDYAYFGVGSYLYGSYARPLEIRNPLNNDTADVDFSEHEVSLGRVLAVQAITVKVTLNAVVQNVVLHPIDVESRYNDLVHKNSAFWMSIYSSGGSGSGSGSGFGAWCAGGNWSYLSPGWYYNTERGCSWSWTTGSGTLTC